MTPRPKQMRQAARRWSSPVQRTCEHTISKCARRKEVLEWTTYHNHGNQCRNHESNINLHVSEQNEPSVPSSTLEFSSAFGTTHTTCWVLTTNTDTQQETPCSQGSKETRTTASSSITTCAECSKEDQDDGTGEQTPLARIVVGGIAENEHL
jgi:hypothetical protein